MKKGMKSKNLDWEKEISSELKGVIVDDVIDGSGSAKRDIVEGVIAAVKSNTDCELYNLMIGENVAAAEEEGVANGIFLVTNVITLEVATVGDDIVKKYVLPS